MQQRTKAAIAVMFNSYSQSQNTDPDALLLACDIALEGLRDDAIQDACRRFMKGQVLDVDRHFAPSVAQLAVECQSRHDYFTLCDERASRPAIVYKPVENPIISDEEKARVGVNMKALTDRMFSRISEAQFREITGTKFSDDWPDSEAQILKEQDNQVFEYVHDPDKNYDYLIDALDAKIAKGNA